MMSCTTMMRAAVFAAALVASALMVHRQSHALDPKSVPWRDITAFVPWASAPNVWFPEDAIAFEAHQGGDLPFHLFRLMMGHERPRPHDHSYSTEQLSWFMGGGLPEGHYFWARGKRGLMNPEKPSEGYNRSTRYRSSGAAVQRALSSVSDHARGTISVLAWCNSAETCSDGTGGVRPVGTPNPHVALRGPLNAGIGRAHYPSSDLVIPGLGSDPDVPMRVSLGSEETHSLLHEGPRALDAMGIPRLVEEGVGYDVSRGEFVSAIPAKQMPQRPPPTSSGGAAVRVRGAMDTFDLIGLGASAAHAYDRSGAEGAAGVVANVAGVAGAHYGMQKAGKYVLKKGGTRIAGKAAGHALKRFVPGLGWAMTTYDAYKSVSTYWYGDAEDYDARIADDPIWWGTYQVIYGLGLY